MGLCAEEKSQRLINAGNELQSSSSLQIEELLQCLDNVESLLLEIEQTPSPPLLDALFPPMKALIRPDLMTHQDMGVKASVFSCLMEITRISAPDAPFSDEKTKEIFELGIEVLDRLSLSEGRAYQKAVSALTVIAKVKAVILLLDIKGDVLIHEMFSVLLKHVRSDHVLDVFPSMVATMTQALKESDEISSDILSLLLSSVRRDNQETSPMTLRLGETVITECGDTLQGYIADAVRKGDINLGDYSEVVSFINCGECHVAKVDVARDALNEISNNDRADSGRGIFIMDSELPGSRPSSEGRDGVASREEMGKFEIDEPDCMDVAQPVLSPPLIERDDLKKSSPNLAGALETRHSGKLEEGQAGESLPPKRGRKPNSLMNPEEGYDSPLIGFGKGGSQSVCQRKLAKSLTQPKRCSQKRKASELDQDDNTQKKTPKSLVLKLRNKETASESVQRKAKAKSETLDVAEDRSGVKGGRKTEKSASGKKKTGSVEAGYALVGQRITVWWPLDKVFYDGTVKSYDPSNKKHHVQYDDGDKEFLNLKKQQWELCEAKLLDSEDLKVKRNPKKQVKEETMEYSSEEWDLRRTGSAPGKQSKKPNQAIEPKSAQSGRSQPSTNRKTNSWGSKKVKTSTEPKQEKAESSERYLEKETEEEIKLNKLDQEITGSSPEAERIDIPAVEPNVRAVVNDDELQHKESVSAKIKKLKLSYSGPKKKAGGK